MQRVRIVALLGIVILSALASFGQMNTGNITGIVTDPSGSVIVGATANALHIATQQKFSSVTNGNGQYLFAQLPLGEYRLTVDAQGFKESVQEHVIVHVNDYLRQDFALQLGNRNETVTVEATSGLVQTETAEVKDVVENQQVVNLPLKGRQFLELALLNEGVVNPPGGTRGDSLQQTGVLINALGNRTGHNLFMVDGVSVTDEYFNNVAFNPSVDATAEFNLDMGDYSAEFGGKSGAVINVITKSGTNDFHGTVYEFLRNNVFNAENFFALPGVGQPFRQSQFGASLGGPVIKNKTFFFLNYDGQRTRDSLSQIFSVPTAVQDAGNLSTLVPVATKQLVDPITKSPIPGNNLANDPNYHPNAAAQAILAKLLSPTSSGNSNNLLAIAEQRIDQNQYTARIDQQIGTNDTAFVRGSVFDANEFDPFGSSVLNEALMPGFGRTLRTHTDNISASETHIFSSAVVNEFRFGWLRVSGGQGDPNAGNPFASQVGLLGTTSNPADMGYPQFNLSGVFSTIGTATGFNQRTDRNVEIYDNVVDHRGRHTIQFGGYFFHLSFNPLYPNNARGTYTFNGSYTGNAFADFLFGFPSQAQVGIGEGAENAHTDWAHFYIQDGWQVTSRLRLDGGLRYEYNGNLVADANQTSNIDLTAPGGPAFVVSGNPGTLNSAQAALASIAATQIPAIPVVSAAGVGWNASLLTTKPFRLSPRVGLAWQVPGLRDTVVRAGYGIYTNQAAYSVLQNLAENIPFYLNKTVNNTTGTPASNINNILTLTPNGAIGANGVNHDFAIEYNEVWNLTLQKSLGANTALEAEYIGSRTVHADSATVINVPQAGPGAVQERRPYPDLNSFAAIRWNGWASFNSLALKATHRFAQGVFFETNYMWSHSIDDASDAGTTNAEYNLPQNIYVNDLAAEKASSSFDRRNRLTANVLWDLPLARNTQGLLDEIAGGWRLGSILIAQSGAPFTINLSSSTDPANIGLVNGVNIERPNVTGDPDAGFRTTSEWFNTADFSVPAQFTFGSTPRNDVIGPTYFDLDLSLQKEWALHERAHLQFRFDAFNSLNHPNFNLPGRIFGASNFGVITSAQDPRELQFALKLLF